MFNSLRRLACGRCPPLLRVLKSQSRVCYQGTPLFTGEPCTFNRVQYLCKSNYCSQAPSDKASYMGSLKDRKFLLGFTCKVCSTRNTKYISHQAYYKGVIIVRCDGCSNNHLIADNLNWFQEGRRNIEDILASKGQSVKKFITTEGQLEYVENPEDPPLLPEK